MRGKYILLCLLIASFAIGNIENRLAIKVKGLQCRELDKNFLNFTVCQIKAIKRDVEEISIWITLLQKPVTNASVHLTIKRRGFEHNKPLIEYKVDACAFMSNKRRNPLAEWGYRIFEFAKYSNMNHSCPYNEDIVFEKYRFDENYISLIPVPTGHYEIKTVWFAFNVPRGQISGTVNFYEK